MPSPGATLSEPGSDCDFSVAAGLALLPALASSSWAWVVPLADGWLDVVVCAQAFHWFASPDALREIGRVLKAGGRLGLVWNVRDESVDWVAAITRITAPYQGDTPRFHSGEWRRLFPSELFSELEETVVSYRQQGSAQQVIVDRVLSVSFIAALPDAERGAGGRQPQRVVRDPARAQGSGIDRISVPDARVLQHSARPAAAANGR